MVEKKTRAFEFFSLYMVCAYSQKTRHLDVQVATDTLPILSLGPIWTSAKQVKLGKQNRCSNVKHDFIVCAGTEHKERLNKLLLEGSVCLV